MPGSRERPDRGAGETRPAAGTPVLPADQLVADLGERALIARLHARVPPPPDWVAVGIGDDGAVVEPARNSLEVLTTDALIEGVHFDLRFTTPADVGHRALAVNLSDLAAMGAEPRAALLSLGLPGHLRVGELDDLVDAFLALAAEYRVTLVGGNLTRSPGPLMIDVTLTGCVRRRRVLTRAGARPGDELFVSGTIGAGLAGLEVLRDRERDAPGRHGDAELASCVARYRRPEPRVRLGVLLGRNRAASACVDLSDGLADALRQMAVASGVGVRLQADGVPIDPAAGRWFETTGRNALEVALAGGDEYELLVAVPRRRRRAFDAVARLVRNVPLACIGVVTREPDLCVTRGDREGPLPTGFAHFGDGM